MTEHHSIVSLKQLLEEALFHELFEHSEVETTVTDDVTTCAVTTRPVSTIPRCEAIRRARHTAAALGLSSKLQLLIKDDDESLEVALWQVEQQQAAGIASSTTEDVSRGTSSQAMAGGDEPCEESDPPSANSPPRAPRENSKTLALLQAIPTAEFEGDKIEGTTARQLEAQLEQGNSGLVTQCDAIPSKVAELKKRGYCIVSGVGQGSSGYKRLKWQESGSQCESDGIEQPSDSSDSSDSSKQ